jgi:menaquinol-cytochrome c reductase cytochrome b/c subunit
MTEIPEHLLKRAQAAREKAAGATGADAAPAGDRIPDALLDRTKSAGAGAAAVVATAPAAGLPVGAGPGGHTQRLLTVVKSGSIQEAKAAPVDKVHTWPHLLAVEFVASLAMLAALFIFSWVVNAPLLKAADFNQTPNPSKAPWYFLGLQELLTMFHPMIAGVTLPGVGILALIPVSYTHLRAHET